MILLTTLLVLENTLKGNETNVKVQKIIQNVTEMKQNVNQSHGKKILLLVKTISNKLDMIYIQNFAYILAPTKTAAIS